MNKNLALRAAAYCRVSTEEQALRGYSIETQIDALEEYCSKHDLVLVDKYIDEGISGTKPPMKRPALKRLLEDVEKGSIDIILFTRLDRWFRSVQEYFKVQEILEHNNVGWKAIWEDYDTTTANGKMSITLFLAIAQNERDKTSERIKNVFDHKLKQKEVYFGENNTPLGYTIQRDEKGVARLVKDPKTKDLVQEYWDMLLTTNNMRGTVRHIQNKYDVVRSSRSWSRMSSLDYYYGCHKGVENFCEPYITKDQFDLYHSRRPIKATPTGSIFLFSRLMRCPRCGARLSGYSVKPKDRRYYAYQCALAGRTCFPRSSYSESKIEKQLLASLGTYIKDEIASVEIQQRKTHHKKSPDVKTLKERKRRLTVAYVSGNMSDTEYLSKASDLDRQIDLATQDAKDVSVNIDKLKELLSTDFRSLYEMLDREERRSFWQQLLSEIEIDENKKIKSVIFLR